jgi:hypothetical protein
MAERWQEVARNLGVGEMVSAEAAGEAIEVRDKRIAELEAENAALAADQCHKGYGDDRGNHRCAYQDRIADLENQLDIANAKLAKAEGGGSTPFEEIEW